MHHSLTNRKPPLMNEDGFLKGIFHELCCFFVNNSKEGLL